MSNPQSPPAMIEVRASYFFLAFLLAFFKPQVSIDASAPFQVEWKTVPIPVSPGRHQVEVWLPYLFMSQMGKNGIVVDVPPGGIVTVHWRAPWLVFLKGAITASPPRPMTAGGPLQPAVVAPVANPGGWHPDPARRHEQRYYDGTAWTEHVVDAGNQSTDPIH